MALVLQSFLGGVACDFQVVHQANGTFHSSVASKRVGIMIHHLGKFLCKTFAIFFILLHDGAPDYV